MSLENKKLSETNKFLKNKEIRKQLLLKSVITSSLIEGISLKTFLKERI